MSSAKLGRSLLRREVETMDLSMGIAGYSMAMSQAKAAQSVQVSMTKKVMDLQQDMMAQLLETMGVGANMNIEA